uniref:hypothetical protein n=1 Tax=Nocardia cyriacigeorgica TaxID=135487 RepID=UPI002455A96E
KWSALGPLVESAGLTTKGVTVHPDQEVTELARKHGVMDSGVAAGRPALRRPRASCPPSPARPPPPPPPRRVVVDGPVRLYAP